MNTWKMSDGTQIAISDMTDTHLMNAYRFVMRSIPPSTIKASMLKDELKRRGLHQHPKARPSKDEAANYRAMAEAEYSAWEADRG
jgi:hypothetical protein